MPYSPVSRVRLQPIGIHRTRYRFSKELSSRTAVSSVDVRCLIVLSRRLSQRSVIFFRNRGDRLARGRPAVCRTPIDGLHGGLTRWVTPSLTGAVRWQLSVLVAWLAARAHSTCQTRGSGQMRATPISWAADVRATTPGT